MHGNRKCPAGSAPLTAHLAGGRSRNDRNRATDRAFTLDLMAAIISFTIREDGDDEDVDDDNAGRDSLFSLTEHAKSRQDFMRVISCLILPKSRLPAAMDRVNVTKQERMSTTCCDIFYKPK